LFVVLTTNCRIRSICPQIVAASSLQTWQAKNILLNETNPFGRLCTIGSREHLELESAAHPDLEGIVQCVTVEKVQNILAIVK
jgi:hypothetical protein